MSRTNDPFDELEEIFEQLTDFGVEMGGREPAVDVRDEGEEFVVVADLPGFETDDIDVRLREGRKLEIHAERERSAETTDAEYVRRERRQDVVSRTLTLPEAVEEAETSATFENGVLSVTLQKQTVETDGTDIPVS